jgi:hypothetical protein
VCAHIWLLLHRHLIGFIDFFPSAISALLSTLMRAHTTKCQIRSQIECEADKRKCDDEHTAETNFSRDVMCFLLKAEILLEMKILTHIANKISVLLFRELSLLVFVFIRSMSGDNTIANTSNVSLLGSARFQSHFEHGCKFSRYFHYPLLLVIECSRDES